MTRFVGGPKHPEYDIVRLVKTREILKLWHRMELDVDRQRAMVADVQPSFDV